MVKAAQAAASASKPANKKRKVKDPFSYGGKWQAVQVADDFLVGAEEGGFCGLEILEGVSVFDGMDTSLLAEPDAGPADSDTQPELKLPGTQKAIAKLGFSKPTPIQSECLLPAIRDRRDVIGAAQTGSGKTLAFGLPIMHALLAEREAAAATHASPAPTAPAPVTDQDTLAPAEDVEASEAADAPDVDAKADMPAALRRKAGPLRALILAPTRELAMQVSSHLQAIGRECGIWVVPIVGGISQVKQERLLKRRPEVVVATPGRLWDLMRDGHKHLTQLQALSFLVLDEADRMVQQGHFQEMENILDLIPKGQPEPADPEDEPEDDPSYGAEADGAANDDIDASAVGRRRTSGGKFVQTFVFSATLTLPASLRHRLKKGGGGSSGSSSLENLMEKIQFGSKPKIANLTSERKLADKVEEAYIECTEAERDEFLYYLLAQHPGRTLVFVNAISSIRRLGALLKLLGLPAAPLHASMQQRQRLKALDRFKANDDAILVASDVAARGLDVKNVRCVIHYQVPASADVYVHRSGRTARANADGISIMMVVPQEAARYGALLKALDRPTPPAFPVDGTLLPAVHKRVRLAVRIDEMVHEQNKAAVDLSWKQRHAEELGIILSDDEDSDAVALKKGKRRGEDKTVTVARLQQELAALLAAPLQPKYNLKYFTGGTAAAVATAPSLQPGSEGAIAGSSSAEAVALAQRLHDSKAAAGVQLQARKASKAKKAKRTKQVSQQSREQAALAAALAQKQNKQARKRGLVVIPAAFGRESQGPDALAALRRQVLPPTSAKA
ncbi:hypothetical protein WJX72_009411 [[Myrmecia] bisecta]|uniref:DEAD-box ATP-dependent RNA helicase 13 n=1 Tax=[Myrmecia] bisecta TaxID=41462 RepID=A0AAW1PUE1_9CHLO